MNQPLTTRGTRRALAFALIFAVAGSVAAGRGPGGFEPPGPSREILRASGVKGGLVVHLGCGAGELTTALHPSDSFLVHGLDASAANIAKARELINARGLDGKVSVEKWTGKRLPYASNLVRLLVAEDLGAVAMSEVMRVLCPGGIAAIKQSGKWTMHVKPRPAELDEWTHFRRDAGGNMVSRDRLVGPPRHVQWVAGPNFQRHHGIAPTISSLVSSGGRMFYLIDDAPLGWSGVPDRWQLLARDAFSGIRLWERAVPDWGSSAWSYWTEGHSARFNQPQHIRKRLVAVGDRVYVTLGFNAPVAALDAATGAMVREYQGTEFTDEFVVSDGVLYAAVNDRPQKVWPGKGVDPAPPTPPPAPSQKQVWAIRAATGEVLWKAGPFLGNAAKPDRLGSMRHLNLTVGAMGAFVIDEREVVGLDLQTGKERWRIERLRHAAPPAKPYSIGDLYHKLISPNTHAVIYHNDLLYVLHPGGFDGFKSAATGIVQALAPETGRELWRHETATPIAYLDHPDVFGIGNTIWIPDKKAMTLIALDAATGKEQRTISIKRSLDVGHHHRCYPNRASVDYVILGRRGAEFVDLASGEVGLHHWARGGCRNGHLLANGLFYRPPDHCRCYMAFQPRGFLALASESAAPDFEACLEKTNALEQGPAYNKIPNPQSPIPNRADWPTYRHDAMRNGMATTVVPRSLKTAWRVAVAGTPSVPVVAAGRVFCATEEDHQVHALDAETGERRWSFTANGRVDSPPTIHQGLAIFGCRDGWVYALRATDGALAWRFRAAPGERRIVADGQLESAWPVNGSVLVAGDTAYFVAGRASVLDRGVYAYAVKAATGELIERNNIYEIQTDSKTTGELPQGALPDILTSDGANVYLRDRKLEFSTAVAGAGPAVLASVRPRVAADGGFFDQQWFHRAFWKYQSALGRASGNLIVFDGQRAYVAAANQPGPNNQTFHIPAGGIQDRVIGLDGQGPSWCANPNLQIGGCVLFAAEFRADRKGEKESAPESAPAVKKGKAARTNKNERVAARWRDDHFPLLPGALLSDGKTLFVAGAPDRLDKKNPWAAFEGRAGGALVLLDAESGKQIAEHPLDAPPVWNGIAAANERLYLSTKDGRIICMERKP